MDSLKFVLDTNVFIAAHRTYYPFDIVSAFWEALRILGERGLICSVQSVLSELDPKPRQRDALANWVHNEFRPYFNDNADSKTLGSFGAIVKWTEAQSQWTYGAKQEFFGGADIHVIAFAHANRCAVVTLETRKSNAKTIIKIPDVCDAFGIRVYNTFEMLRQLGVTFPTHSL